jgi:2-oxoisovalerate dehydrogenase E2 component (dihydrolipoyl transacylase)
MALFTFKLPDVGEGVAESEIATWRVAVGDVVTEEQPLVDMLTDKAAVEIPSPVAGKVVELRGNAGDKIAVGSALVVIETDASISSPATAGEGQGGGAAVGSSSTSKATPPPQSSPVNGGGRPAAAAAPVRLAGEKALAAPSVRKRAREMGLDINIVPGTGRGGRVTHEDLLGFGGAGAVPAAPAQARGKATGVEQIKVIGMRRKIAEAMQRSKRNIPHFAYVEECDVTELEALRMHLNASKRPEQPKLTLLPFLLRALVKAVPAFPNVNATYDDEQGVLTRYQALHVGIAAQTPQGLVVPVVKHAEALDIWGAAAEIRRLAEAARAGKATREELTGGSITISSLGPMGGIVSTPIINAPEVAIVGVNKLVERPVVKNGQIVVRQMMNLSSSFDHRIVDGWDAASFIQAVKTLLEHPATLFMP